MKLPNKISEQLSKGIVMRTNQSDKKFARISSHDRNYKQLEYLWMDLQLAVIQIDAHEGEKRC